MNDMNQYPSRPTMTSSLIRTAVQSFAKDHPDFIDTHGSDCIEDIAEEYALGMDGYELCKRLDKWQDWDTDRDDMDTLDELDGYAREVLLEAERRWIEQNNIQPPYPNGQRVKCAQRLRTGVIDRPCERQPGCYLVIPDDPSKAEVEGKARWICKFEKVTPIELEAA